MSLRFSDFSWLVSLESLAHLFHRSHLRPIGPSATTFPINVTVLLFACSVLAKEFDYIVVGGGTTGLPLAVRLAEYWNLALVEAGGRYEKRYPLAKTLGADVLPVGSDPETSSSIDWGFVTEPFLGANGRRLHVAQGKCLGGS
jgi:hypothetical protein